MVTSFKYLGQVISANDDDWTEAVRNLDWAKKLWRRMLHILRKEGATPRVYGFFFKAVKQAVLILVKETSVFNPRTGKDLEGFQTQMERRVTGKFPHRTTDRKWNFTWRRR